jgi:hypothetical protein
MVPAAASGAHCRAVASERVGRGRPHAARQRSPPRVLNLRRRRQGAHLIAPRPVGAVSHALYLPKMQSLRAKPAAASAPRARPAGARRLVVPRVSLLDAIVKPITTSGQVRRAGRRERRGTARCAAAGRCTPQRARRARARPRPAAARCARSRCRPRHWRRRQWRSRQHALPLTAAAARTARAPAARNKPNPPRCQTLRRASPSSMTRARGCGRRCGASTCTTVSRQLAAGAGRSAAPRAWRRSRTAATWRPLSPVEPRSPNRHPNLPLTPPKKATTLRAAPPSPTPRRRST